MALRPRVNTAKDAATDTGITQDPYLTKVVKYIPAEIVAAYVAASRALEAARDQVAYGTLVWVVAGALVVLTPIWTLYATREAGRPPAVFQATAATAAFACWVFALGGPFELMTWYRPVYGTLVLVFATLVIPLVEKISAPRTSASNTGAS